MIDDVKKWMDKKGKRFLEGIGVAKGQTVLDFGSGEGHYTIPVSKVVGANAKVYALDKDRNALDKLKKTTKKNNIKNIELIEKNAEVTLENNSVDVVLCYDVIHYENKRQREAIYHEIHRVLKEEGLFSLYPKHHKQDSPLDNLADMELKDIIEEVVKAGFVFKEKRLENLLHDDYFNQGYILAFKKLTNLNNKK